MRITNPHSLAARKVRRLAYLIPGWVLLGSVTYLIGPRGGGKSVIKDAMAAPVSAGTKALGLDYEPGRLLRCCSSMPRTIRAQ